MGLVCSGYHTRTSIAIAFSNYGDFLYYSTKYFSLKEAEEKSSWCDFSEVVGTWGQYAVATTSNPTSQWRSYGGRGHAPPRNRAGPHLGPPVLGSKKFIGKAEQLFLL